MFRWSRKGQRGAGFSQALYYYPSLCVQPAQSRARQQAIFWLRESRLVGQAITELGRRQDRPPHDAGGLTIERR